VLWCCGLFFFFSICSGIPVFLSKKMEIDMLIREIFTFFPRFQFSAFSFVCGSGAYQDYISKCYWYINKCDTAYSHSFSEINYRIF